MSKGFRVMGGSDYGVSGFDPPAGNKAGSHLAGWERLGRTRV